MIKCKSILTGLILFFGLNLCYAQNSPDYTKLIGRAYALYQSKQYRSSAVAYTSAFKTNKKDVRSYDVYNAACSWALVNHPDSAFYYLYMVARKYKYSNLAHIKKDEDLNGLHRDNRWQGLLKKVSNNLLKAESRFNKPLIKQLDTIYTNDQKYRGMIDSIEKKYGLGSKERKQLFEEMKHSDSVNLLKVTSMLKQYGWMGSDVLGERGSETVWLVIQHADLKTQKHYLPMIRKSFKQGKFLGYYLALLEDRIAVREGRKQIYGSQFEQNEKTGKYSLSPVEDEKNVDKRRAAAGLPPIKEDAKLFGIDYKAPQ